MASTEQKTSSSGVFAASVQSAVAVVRALSSFASVKLPTNIREGLTYLNSADDAGYFPIHHAAVTGNHSLLGALLSVFAHVRVPVVDVKDRRGMTALQWAIQRGQGAAIKQLVDGGASLLRQDLDGRDALMHAVIATSLAQTQQKQFFHDMTRYLLQSGADVTQKDTNGASALHYAAESGDSELVGILIEVGASPVNAKDDESENPLFYALREGKIEAAKRLIRHGVDLASKNSSNEDVIEFCRSINYQDALSMFASIFQSQQNVTMADSKELASSANLFGSNSFNPSFNSQSNHLYR